MFDSYHVWLGIPPAEQPPNHYRLLGIRLFEDAPEVIENATDQRMAHLRTLQGGRHSAQSQKLLNEVSSAKLCLLDRSAKLRYDATLRGGAKAIRPPAPVPIPLMPRPAAPASITTGIPTTIPSESPPAPWRRSVAIERLLLQERTKAAGYHLLSRALWTIGGMVSAGALLVAIFRQPTPADVPVVVQSPQPAPSTAAPVPWHPPVKPETDLSPDIDQEPEPLPPSPEQPDEWPEIEDEATTAGDSETAPAPIESKPTAWTTEIVLPDGRTLFPEAIGLSPGQVDQIVQDMGEDSFEQQSASGKTISVSCFNEKGKLHGDTVVRYERGPVMFVTSYDDSQRNGRFRLWSDDGRLLLYGEYTKNRRHGVFVLFDGAAPSTILQFQGDTLKGAYRVHAVSEVVAAESLDLGDSAAAEAVGRLDQIEKQIAQRENFLKQSFSAWFREKYEEWKRGMAARGSVIKRYRIILRGKIRDAKANAAMEQNLREAMWWASPK